MRRNTAADFWTHVNKSGPVHPVLGTPCWLWVGRVGRPKGYGQFDFVGRTVRAHRFAWETVAGREIPGGHGVLHRCDVRLCVNYEQHLFTGTQLENIRDRDSKGRQAIGGRCGNSKLTPEDMLVAENMRLAGETWARIAARLGVNPVTVYRALVRRAEGRPHKHSGGIQSSPAQT